MRFTRRRLRKIIREEKRRILEEAWSDPTQTGSSLIAFARVYSGLGDAVQSQVDSIVAAANSFSLDSEQFEEAASEQNPNAIDMAMQRLSGPLQMMGWDEAEEILDALKDAQKIYLQGDEEVERDRAAAEGR